MKTNISVKNLRKSQTSIPLYYLLRVIHRSLGKNIHCHQNVFITGLKNIQTNAPLYIGTSYVGFIHRSDRTFLNIQGKLIINGNYYLGRGCRLDIGRDAICTFGDGSTKPNTKFIIMHGLTIGNHVVISWDCEFLDEDFHSINYYGKIERDPKIVIGDNVWIGSGVKVLKGVKIGNGNVIAANSVVTQSFEDSNLLIAGNPAKVIQRNITWQ